jgi:hypothetical protein
MRSPSCHRRLEAFPIDSGVTAALALCAAFYAPEIQGDHQPVRYRPGAGHRIMISCLFDECAA